MEELQNVFWSTSKIAREDRYRLNQHKSCILWFTGLSASGKSTLAIELEKRLFEQRIRSYVMDGDNIRYGLNKNLGFSPEDRKENIRRIGEVARLFVDAGLFAITSFISPYRGDREMVRQLFEENEFIEIFVKCSLDECERRDPKGLYQKARIGIVKDFTGISAPYEEPINPEIIVETDQLSIEQSVSKIMNYLKGRDFL